MESQPKKTPSFTLWVACFQAEALDGGKRWKNEKVTEEKAATAGFGSPSKGQAINLLDTVSSGISSMTKHWSHCRWSVLIFCLALLSVRLCQCPESWARGSRGTVRSSSVSSRATSSLSARASKTGLTGTNPEHLRGPYFPFTSRSKLSCCYWLVQIWPYWTRNNSCGNYVVSYRTKWLIEIKVQLCCDSIL